ncbi:MAG: hypothetical protein J6V15_00300 [Clostridia bacterium]|nr:hypothetical protein [Clostridia bacterium]
MKEDSARGAGVAILLVFAAFLIFNIWSGLTEKINYIEASSVTVEELVSLNTVFIRDQVILRGKTDNIEYLVQNGDKVAANQPVCIYFKSADALDNYRKLVEIDNEIAAIEAVDAMISSGTDSVKLDGLVYTYLGDLLAGTEDGRITQVSDVYDSMRQVIIARDAGLYSKDIFAERLDDLKSQRAVYDSIVDRGSETVVSPCSGYFFSKTDGYEDILNTDCLSSLSADILGSAERFDAETDDVIGTVVNSFEWYLVSPVDDAHLYDFRGKSSFSLYFPELLSNKNKLALQSLEKGADGKYYLVLKSTVMIPEYLSTRFQPVDVVMNTYTGIKVPIEALHQKNGSWGVYCLEGASAKFKKTNIIYQTDSYYLLEMAENASKGLYIYDKIIISGKDFNVK